MIQFTRYEIFITILFFAVGTWNVWSSLRRLKTLAENYAAANRMERAAYAADLAKMKAVYDEQSALMQAQYDKSVAALRVSFDRTLGLRAEELAKKTKERPS